MILSLALRMLKEVSLVMTTSSPLSLHLMSLTGTSYELQMEPDSLSLDMKQFTVMHLSLACQRPNQKQTKSEPLMPSRLPYKNAGLA